MDNLKIASISFLFLLLNQNSFTISTDLTSRPTAISSVEYDVTGDGQNENIQIKGNLLKNNRDYYQDIWIDIENPYSEKWSIPLTGGYNPTIQLIDLNQNHIKDIFYQSIKNKENGLYAHHLYSLKNGIIKKVPLPEQSHINGNFRHDFQIEIQVTIKMILR